MRTFRSADGSVRCLGCHLHLDACTCGHMARILTMLGVLGTLPTPGDVWVATGHDEGGNG